MGSATSTLLFALVAIFFAFGFALGFLAGRSMLRIRMRADDEVAP